MAGIALALWAAPSLAFVSRLDQRNVVQRASLRTSGSNDAPTERPLSVPFKKRSKVHKTSNAGALWHTARCGLTFPSRCDAGLQTLSPLLFAPAAPFSLHASVSPLAPLGRPLSPRRSRPARPLSIPPLVRLEVLERHRGGLLERVGRVLDARVVVHRVVLRVDEVGRVRPLGVEACEGSRWDHTLKVGGGRVGRR